MRPTGRPRIGSQSEGQRLKRLGVNIERNDWLLLDRGWHRLVVLVITHISYKIGDLAAMGNRDRESAYVVCATRFASNRVLTGPVWYCGCR